MAAGILIKKGVEEHETGLVDGGFLGNQCNLAQHGSTLVHGEHFLQDFFTFFCVTVHDSSVFEINGKVVKPSHEVLVGDIVGVTFGSRKMEVRVLSIQEVKRKQEASDMYEIVSQSFVEKEERNE